MSSSTACTCRMWSPIASRGANEGVNWWIAVTRYLSRVAVTR
jgi:hypothetical protein